MSSTEPTPGLLVRSFVPEGQAYRMDARLFGLGEIGLGGSPYVWAISEADWLRMQGPNMERFLDDATRMYAQRGTSGIELLLLAHIGGRRG